MTLRIRLFLTATLAVSALAAHADTIYTTQSSFDAAAPGDTTVTFGSLIANGLSSYIPSGNLSVGSVGFNVDTSTSTGDLFEIGANLGTGHYGADATLSSQASTTSVNNLVITLPSGEDSVSILFNGWSDANLVFITDPVTVTFSDGTSETVTDSAADGSYLFLGIISATPITSIDLTDPIVGGDATLNVAQVEYGSPTAAPTPEPSSLVLLGTGILGFAGAARRRFLTA